MRLIPPHTVDENLDWHVKSCKAKISRGLYTLNKIKHILNTNNIRIIYHSLIYPYLTYGILLSVMQRTFVY